MKWYGISGSWRNITSDVERDVKDAAESIILYQGGSREGEINPRKGIVTGGALGVDFLAAQTVLEKGDPERQLRIYLPVGLEKYLEYYESMAKKGAITYTQAADLARLLTGFRAISSGIISHYGDYEEVNRKSYYERNTGIVRLCDELYSFQVNDSRGTQDAIDKAISLGKIVHLKRYYTQDHVPLNGKRK